MRSNDAYGAAAELGASQHGAFTRTQATLIGLTPRDIRRLIDLQLLREVLRGVLAFTCAPSTARQRLWVATHACGGGFDAAFEAAAWLHRLDGFDRGKARSRWSAGVTGLAGSAHFIGIAREGVRAGSAAEFGRRDGGRHVRYEYVVSDMPTSANHASTRSQTHLAAPSRASR